MVKKYRFGTPFETGAVIQNINCDNVSDATHFKVKEKNGNYIFNFRLAKSDAVYGLGEQIRGINKRGWIYKSYNEDDYIITENRTALYASHNFLLLSSQKPIGLFFDFAGKVVFDIGYTKESVMQVTANGGGYLYFISGGDLDETVKEFRQIIGESYIPPKWAFGIGQSRWGYKDESDIRRVYENYKKNHLPIDMIYLDIDYMQDYKDFTIDETRFPNFKNFVEEMKSEGVRLVPIVDAAIKVKDDYPVYLEGLERKAYCTDKEGEPFVVGVWPGDSVLPDVLNDKSAKWFAEKYKFYLDKGIEAFWNDMNEPAIFYSKKRLRKVVSELKKYEADMPIEKFNEMRGQIYSLQNNCDDYKEMYHNVDGDMVSHDKVHNLYGYKITKCSAEYIQEYAPEKRYLLFSRSSYIGMHRYAGIWTGDNSSWWQHILLNLQMLPALNMCGFLYVGADVGGFACNTTKDLLLRWMALSVFCPLYRNHSTQGSRMQEPYMFGEIDKFRSLIQTRYALLPFIYSEYVKSAVTNGMMFKPMSFCFPLDKIACETEDQIVLGDSVIIAPVYKQNSMGRSVYLPEDMLEVRFKGANYKTKPRKKGYAYVKVDMDEVVVFLRKGKVLPVAKPAERVMDIDFNDVTFVKNIDEQTVYTICLDDGVTSGDIKKYLKEVVVNP